MGPTPSWGTIVDRCRLTEEGESAFFKGVSPPAVGHPYPVDGHTYAYVGSTNETLGY